MADATESCNMWIELAPNSFVNFEKDTNNPYGKEGL
jgi:hypothetical protein